MSMRHLKLFEGLLRTMVDDGRASHRSWPVQGRVSEKALLAKLASPSRSSPTSPGPGISAAKAGLSIWDDGPGDVPECNPGAAIATLTPFRTAARLGT